MNKFCLIGTQEYEDRRKIKEVIWELKKRVGPELVIMGGGGQNGANKYVKKYSLELGVKYVEYNTADTPYNMYSALNESYYGRNYHPTQVHHRNQMLATACDAMILFLKKEQKSDIFKSAISKINKLKKPITIIN